MRLSYQEAMREAAPGRFPEKRSGQAAGFHLASGQTCSGGRSWAIPWTDWRGPPVSKCEACRVTTCRNFLALQNNRPTGSRTAYTAGSSICGSALAACGISGRLSDLGEMVENCIVFVGLARGHSPATLDVCRHRLGSGAVGSLA